MHACAYVCIRVHMCEWACARVECLFNGDFSSYLPWLFSYYQTRGNPDKGAPPFCPP